MPERRGIQLSIEDKARLLGGVAYPDGRGWRCSNDHEYPEGFELDRCPVDDLSLGRVALSFSTARAE